MASMCVSTTSNYSSKGRLVRCSPTACQCNVREESPPLPGCASAYPTATVTLGNLIPPLKHPYPVGRAEAVTASVHEAFCDLNKNGRANTPGSTLLESTLSSPVIPIPRSRANQPNQDTARVNPNSVSAPHFVEPQAEVLQGQKYRKQRSSPTPSTAGRGVPLRGNCSQCDVGKSQLVPHHDSPCSLGNRETCPSTPPTQAELGQEHGSQTLRRMGPRCRPRCHRGTLRAPQQKRLPISTHPRQGNHRGEAGLDRSGEAWPE